jgi:uncharacterized protein (TIGR00251 family)
MPLPAYLSERDGAVWLRIKAQPRAKSNGVAGIVGDALKVRTTAPPVDSAANEALVAWLSEVLECPRRQVTLTRGATSPQKVFRIDGLTADTVFQRLETPEAGC